MLLTAEQFYGPFWPVSSDEEMRRTTYQACGNRYYDYNEDNTNLSDQGLQLRVWYLDYTTAFEDPTATLGILRCFVSPGAGGRWFLANTYYDGDQSYLEGVDVEVIPTAASLQWGMAECHRLTRASGWRDCKQRGLELETQRDSCSACGRPWKHGLIKLDDLEILAQALTEEARP